MIKNQLILSILLFFNFGLFATPQSEDLLIWNKDTFYLYDSPLELIPDITNKIFEIQGTYTMSSGCWRGFNAEWIIENNILYLADVYDTEHKFKINKTIEKILKKQYVNGRIKADWVDTIFWCGNNESSLNPFLPIYENEYQLIFKKGILLDFKLSKTNSCIYYENNDSLYNFLYSSVNWESLPKPRNNDYISVLFNINKNGQIIEITNEKSYQPNELIEEAKRVVGLLPCWKILFYKGSFEEGLWRIDLNLNEQNKIKFKKK